MKNQYHLSFAVLIVFPLITIALAQEQLGAGQTIHLNCSSKNKTLYFKTMRQFSLISKNKVDRVEITSNNFKCQFNNFKNHICTLQNMTKEINISCPGVPIEEPRQLELQIERADILQNQDQITSSLVYIPLKQNQEGVLSLKLTDYFASEVIRINSSTKNNDFQFFLHSDCVESIALFEDKFKIAVRKKNNPCTVGLIDHTTDMKFFKTLENITSDDQIYSGFLQKQKSKVFQLPDSNNISLYLMVQSQIQLHLQNLSIRVQFVSENGNQSLQMKNYQLGLPIFDAHIFLNRSFSKMIVTSNDSIFYSLFPLRTIDSKMMVVEDSYLYTQFHKNKETQFVIQLAGFQDQQKVNRVIMLMTSVNKTMPFEYQECLNQACHNTSLTSQKITTGQLTPKCSHIINDMCYIKIHLLSEIDGIFGIIPFTYNSHAEFTLNKVHSGRLQRGNLLHFILPKQELMNSSSEVLIVSVTGAKVYLTYNPLCKRILCTEYWGIANSIEIPNEKKDLFLFIQGTVNSHYTLTIQAHNQIKLSLPEGLGISGQLNINQKSRYYTYKPANSTKGFEINCNGVHNSILLMVNIRKKSFPVKGDSSFSSKDCYIYVSPSEYSAGDIAHITVQRLNTTSKNVIHFNIVAATQGNPFIANWREPFYDYFQKNSTKTFKYLISVPTDVVSFKVDVYQHAQMSPLLISFGDTKLINYNVQIMDVRTFTIDHEKQEKICSSQTQNQCYLYISIFNPSTVGLQVSITAWQKQQAIKLIMGEYSNFQTGGLGQQTHFYLPIQDISKPINIYIFSNHVQIQAIAQIWNANAHFPMFVWPFPTFMFLKNDTLDSLTYSFSSSLYFGKQVLKTANLSALILITVRDRSITLQNNSRTHESNLGNIQIASSNGFLKLREDDKFQYNINNDETYHFQLPISNLLSIEKEEIYFNNVALAGIAEISYYFSNQNYQQKTASFTSAQMIIVKLDDHKSRIGATKSNTQYHSITFVVKCISGTSCKFLASIVTSSSQYRQLTVGVPEQFYIPPHSSAVFQFNDYYNEDFKIKVQREEGFPQYKIKSCNFTKRIECVSELLKKENIIDQSPLILTGRSHQLKIDTKSPYYCKECIYYIVLYSYSESLEGSITITRPGQAIILRESVSLTTELYSDDQDHYIVYTLPDSQRFVSVVLHMGHVNVQLVEMLPTNISKPIIHNQNSTDKSSIYLQLQKTQVSIPYNLKIRSSDNENVMYTIVLSSNKNFISLEDGIPYKNILKPNSNTKFEFQPTGKSTILIVSSSAISINLLCDDTNSTKTHNHNIKHSQVLKTSLLHVNNAECQKYIVEINNKNSTNITIIPNDQQIMLLPFQLAVPSIAKEDFCQMYQLPIQQKTYLKIVLLICNPGNAFLGISHDKHHMLNKKYDKKFNINGDRYMEVFEYTANPGILYFEVHSDFDTLQYTIQVFPFYKQSQQSKVKAVISDSYIDTQLLELNKFKLQFQPLKVLNTEVNYTISYVIVQSPQRSYLRKTLKCTSTFFDIKNPNATFKESNLKVQVSADGSLIGWYESQYPHSYITIIPITSPSLPSYIPRSSYEISQLSSGKGPRLFERLIFKLLGAIQYITGVDDENMLNLMLVFFIVVTNIILITVCCWLGTKHCRKVIIIERKRLATSEREGRLMRVQNSLDMLQPREDIQVVVAPVQQNQRTDIP